MRPDTLETNDFCAKIDALFGEIDKSMPRSQSGGLTHEEVRQILEPLTNLDVGNAGLLPESGPITPKSVDAPDAGDVTAPSVEVPELPPPLKLLRVRPDKAPDCFGRLALFDATSSDCSTCPFAGECCRISERNVRLLGEWRDWCSSAGDDVAVQYSSTFGRSAIRNAAMAMPRPPSRHIDDEEMRNVRALIRRFHLDRGDRRLGREARKDRIRKARKRATPDSMGDATREEIERKRRLEQRVAYPRRSKLYEQLRGREGEIAMWWCAARMASIKHSGAVSDAKIAEQFTLLSGRPATRSQARAKRQLIERLERPGEIWASFVAKGV